MTDSQPFKIERQHPLMIVISGPSGVGKDAVIQRMKERDLQFHFVITATTRPPRDNEVHKRDYYFISNDEFAEMIENDELLEYAVVYGDFKGIPKAEVRKALASGEDVILRVDVQGAATIHKLYQDALLIFVTTETEEELAKRLMLRESETFEGLRLRIATARKEWNRVGEFDYVVVNRDNQLDEAVDVIIAIIEAEHHRVHHREVVLS